jgi:hypothetical protein
MTSFRLFSLILLCILPFMSQACTTVKTCLHNGSFNNKTCVCECFSAYKGIKIIFKMYLNKIFLTQVTLVNLGIVKMRQNHALKILDHHYVLLKKYLIFARKCATSQFVNVATILVLMVVCLYHHLVRVYVKIRIMVIAANH